MSAEPSTRADDFEETTADAEGKLPGQIWDSNAAASLANKETAATSNPPITAFPLLTEIAIFKMILARDERAHYDRTHCGLVGKSYARGYEIQAHCCLRVTRGGLTTITPLAFRLDGR